jgi:4-amino-4-deoxy-L-arabinose transferase-like glycosyltransferase
VSSARRAALLGILLLAAALRVAGLGWGLRHPPHPDEGVFLDNAALMVRSADLDHRYYQYPGLFFYMLGPLVWLMPHDPPGPMAYLTARALVAALGVAACWLMDRLGREVAGSRAGLLAALLLAVSPVAVETAHMVRPDVVLQAFTIAALLAFLRVGPGLGGDGLSGLALGLAGAVKFSAVFLVPSYLARRLLVPGPRLRGLLVSGAVALGIFALASPYALLHLGDFVHGVRAQVGYHYQDRGLAPISYPRMVLFYLDVWPKALGLPAVLLCLLGLVPALRNWRVWVPFLLLPATATAVLATSDVRHDRFLLPALSVGFVLAGLGADRLAGARRSAFVILAALAAAAPLLASITYVRGVVAPSTRDRALDAVEAHAPRGSLVLSSVERLGLDPFRVEVFQVDGLGLSRRVQILEADFVVSKDGDDRAALAGLEEVFEAEPVNPWNGPLITVWRVPASLRPPWQRLHLEPAWLSASEGVAELPQACDGRDDTWWRTEDVQRPGDWLQVTLPASTVLDRIELDVDGNGRLGARALKVLVSTDGRGFVETSTRPGRPPLDEQRVEGKTHSQVFLFVAAVPARAFRLVLTRPGAHRWGVAELRVGARAVGGLGGPESPPSLMSERE